MLQKATPLQDSPVHYRTHLGRNIFLTISSKDSYADISHYLRVPAVNPSKENPLKLSTPEKDILLKRSNKGIRLSMKELTRLQEGLEHIARVNEEFNNILPCWVSHTFKTQLKSCHICMPEGLEPVVSDI